MTSLIWTVKISKHLDTESKLVGQEKGLMESDCSKCRVSTWDHENIPRLDSGDDGTTFEYIGNYWISHF